MSVEIKKVKELDYDVIISLAVIESDEDLSSIFKEDTQLSFNVLRTLIKEGTLKAEIEESIKSIFDGIICTKKEYIQKYCKFASAEPVEETTEDSVEVVIEKVEKVQKETKPKKENALPKWYGKVRLEREIAEQGFKATPLQRAMLELNELKNIYSNLLARGIKDLETGSKLITDEDCRKITSVITVAKRQLGDVIKKK